MSKSNPNFLNRWLDRNPVTPLTRARFYLVIPAFDISSIWFGYSDIVGAYQYNSPNRFTIKDFKGWVPKNPNYTLCVAWSNFDGTVSRYRLWTAVGERIFTSVPLYNGQIVEKNFTFEIWNAYTGQPFSTISSQTIDLTPITTSVLQDIDYRYGTDMVLVNPSALVTNFGCSPSLVTPPLTGLEVWLDANVGVTVQSGTIPTWADRTGHIIMQQGDPVEQPMLATGAVRFLGVENLIANIRITPATTKYYIIMHSPVGGLNSNRIMNTNGLSESLTLDMAPIGTMTATFFGTPIAGIPFVAGNTIVEIDTLAGTVYTHSTATGGELLIGTSLTAFSDSLYLALGGGMDSVFQLDEQGNIIEDEQGIPILLESGTDINAGFDLTGLLAYTTQSDPDRLATLQYLLRGMPLPFVFPPGSYLQPNFP